MKAPPAPFPSGRTAAWRNWAALVLGLFGLTAMVGDLLGSRALKGLGAVSVVAPFPKVFCDMNGVEGFACEFAIHYDTATGEHRREAITPELYAQLAGPYNRRNVYGAALAGAPILPAPVWESVFQYGFAPDGPLRRELGLPPDATNIAVVIHTKTRGRNGTWTLHPSCAR
jgi:hypothetical protein